eukprot:4229704-Amphidinium_carterae.1
MSSKAQPSLARYFAPERLGLWPVTSTGGEPSFLQLVTRASFMTGPPAMEGKSGDSLSPNSLRAVKTPFKTW